MGKIIFDISLSLDGFITASNPTPEEPLGDGPPAAGRRAGNAGVGRGVYLR